MAVQVQEVPDGLLYHFNVIYNYPRSKYSVTEDTTLARQVTDYVVEVTAQKGFSKSYFYERDCLPGSNLFTELLKVIKLSQYTFVILTPGFVRDCWSRYCQMTAFKILLEKDRANRLIPVAVDLPEESCPQELTTQSVVWLGRDWRNDAEGWNRVFRVLTEKIPVQQTFQQAANPHPPLEETHLSPQNSFCNLHGGSPATSIVGSQDADLLDLSSSSHGTRDFADGPSPNGQGQPPNRHNQFLGHGSDSQSGESFDDASLFGAGTSQSGQGTRQTDQQRRNLALDHLDAGGLQNTRGTGPAEQRSGAAVTSTVPPRNTGPTDPRHQAPAARGENSSERRNNLQDLAASLERKLELTADSSEEASQVPEATQGSLTIHRQHLSSRPARLQDDSAPRRQHAEPFSQSQVSDLDSYPSIDAPPQGMEAAPPPATPPTPAAQGGTSGTPGGARGTTPSQRDAAQVTTASSNTGRVNPGPSEAVSPSAHGAAADTAGRQAEFLDEEQTFVKPRAAAGQMDSSGFGKSNYPEATNINNSSNAIPTATVDPTARAQPDGADCRIPDAKVPEKTANDASMKDDHSSAVSSFSDETQSTVGTGTTIQQQENSTTSVVEVQQTQGGHDRRTPPFKLALFRTVCNLLRPDQPDF